MHHCAQTLRLLATAGFAALLLLLAPAAMAREEWRFCANEGQDCRVQGTATVRYGAHGQWETRRISDRVHCSNRHFGDPAPNREKRCEVRVDDSGGNGGGWGGSGSSGGWNDCAREGEVCRFNGRAQVRFGDGRNFNTRTARDSIRCDVKTFGDPAFGKVKRCQVQGSTGGWGGSGGSGGNRPSDDDERMWAPCANEGGTCNVGKRTQVRFGVNGRYLYRDVDRSIECSSEAFGRDPAPNQVKTCSWRY